MSPRAPTLTTRILNGSAAILLISMFLVGSMNHAHAAACGSAHTVHHFGMRVNAETIANLCHSTPVDTHIDLDLDLGPVNE